MFKFIGDEQTSFPVKTLCRTLGVSTSGLYSSKKRQESKREQEDRRLSVRVRAAHAESREVYGSPRIHRVVQEQGIHVSRKRVIRLMQAAGLRGKVRRRWVRTTDSNHAFPIAPNILARQFVAQGPNERWVGDITYLRTPQGWLYLAVILDVFSRRVVGWAVSSRIDRQLVLDALQMAIAHRKPLPGLLHHTDRGSQYASTDYQRALATGGAICSMSRRGNCHDNAVAESWFATLKTELGESFESDADARRKLFEYIEVFYNQKRKHSSLDYRSPAEYELAVGMGQAT